MYSTFGGSKYILSDRWMKLTSKLFTWLAKELGFIKVYTSPYAPTDNSGIKQTHASVKASLRKLICNHNIDWDEIAHITTIAYNLFPHSSAGEAPFYCYVRQCKFKGAVVYFISLYALSRGFACYFFICTGLHNSAHLWVPWSLHT